MVDEIEQRGLNQLCLYDRRIDTDQRLSGKYDSTLGNRVNISSKAEIL